MRLILISRSKKKSNTGCHCHASIDYNLAVNCLFWMLTMIMIMMMMMRIISTVHTVQKTAVWECMTARRHRRPKNLIYSQTSFFRRCFFFAFVTFEYAMRSVFVARVFSLATSEFVELFLKQTKKRAKFMVITVVSSVFFWAFVLFGVNMKIPRTFKRRAIHCSCFDFWTRKE